ncbi:MAG: Ig-like domain-containing protein [Clostridia bacterium]|nr:Ig-like domain-containing protein [Clostridia bacterium]
MTESKKKVDKVTVVTVVVVAFLILVFIAGFIWGLNNVLAMEGTMPPSENTESLTPAPETKEDAVKYLELCLNKAIEGKPYFESHSEYDIDNDTLETDGSSQLKDTLLYTSDAFTDYLNDNAPKAQAEYFKGFDALLRKPHISASDIEDFNCDYIFYKCASCGEESDEPLTKCEACGNENPYNLKYRDEYTISFTLKNSDVVLKSNFEPKEGKDALALMGEDVKNTIDVENLKIDYELLTVTFKVNRLTDEIHNLQFSREMNVKADASFKGDFEKVGKFVSTFKMTKDDYFDFTWPSVVLSDNKKTVEPKKSDNLLATLTCDDPLKYDVKWESSDENILTIDDEGYFKAGPEAGEATVTASFDFGGKTYSDTCKVFVRYSVESMKLSDKKLDMKQGETKTLKATVSPEKATVKTVKWYSQDESIATVDENGVVTAVNKGTVKVYALSDDEFYKSTCEVRVK